MTEEIKAPEGKILGEYSMNKSGMVYDFKSITPEVTPSTETQESVDTGEDDTIKGNLPITKTPEEIKAEEEEINKQRAALLENKDAEDPEEEIQESPLKIIAEELKGKGILNIKEDDKFDSDDDFIEIWKRNKEEGVLELFESKFENHPQKDKAKALFEYIENGGDIDKFTEVYANPLSFIDLTNEKDQERVVTLKLKSTSRLSDEKIKEKITKLKDAALLEEEAKDSFEELTEIQKENEQLLIQEQVERAKAAREQTLKTQNEMREFIQKNDSIKGIDIKSKKDKEALIDYLFKPAVKVGNQLVSKYVADSENETLEDFMAIAALKAKGLDLKAIEKSLEVKVKQDLASKLNKTNKEYARQKGEGRVKEEAILKGKELTKDEKERLWRNFSLGV
jgi:hypothetical protein